METAAASQGARKLTPGTWGEPFWVAIHSVALGYPAGGDKEISEAERAPYRDFFRSLGGVLPCSLCREEYSALISRRPPDDALASGREELFKWTVDVHNEVAERLGKPPMTYRFVRDVYVFREEDHPGRSHESSGGYAQSWHLGSATSPFVGWAAALVAMSLFAAAAHYSMRGKTAGRRRV